MLTLEHEVSERLATELPSFLPYRTGYSIKRAALSPALRDFRLFVRGRVESGEFELAVHLALTSMQKIVTDTGLKIVMCRREHCSSGRNGHHHPHSQTHRSHLRSAAINGAERNSSSNTGHRQGHSGNRSRGGDRKGSSNIVFECSRRYDLDKVLASMLLVVESLLLAMTIQLMESDQLDGSAQRVRDLIDDSCSLNPLSFSMAWTRYRPAATCGGGFSPPPMGEELARKLLNICSELHPPVILRSFTGTQTPLLDTERRLMDALQAASQYAANAAPQVYLECMNAAFDASLLSEGQIFQPHHRLVILLVHAPNPDVFSSVMRRVLEILSADYLPVMLKRYVEILVVGSMTRATSHSAKSLNLWEPSRALPLLTDLAHALQEVATRSGDPSLMSELASDSTATTSSLSSSNNSNMPEPLVEICQWCPFDALFLSFLALSVPGEDGMKFCKHYVDQQRQLLDSADHVLRRRAACFFAELGYACWAAAARITDNITYAVAANWCLDCVDLVRKRLAENSASIPAARLVKFHVFCSRYAKPIFVEDSVRVVFDPNRDRLTQCRFIQTVHALHENGSEDEFWALFHSDLEPAIVEVAVGSAKSLDVPLLSYTMDFLLRSRDIMGRMRYENIVRLVKSLVEGVTTADAATSSSIMNNLILMTEFFNDDSPISLKLRRMLSSLLAVQTESLLKPKLTWDLDTLHRLLMWLRLGAEDDAVRLRASLLIAVCSANQRVVRRAIECLRIIHAPLDESDRMLIESLMETDHNRLHSIALVQKRLTGFVASLSHRTPIMKVLLDLLRQFLSAALEEPDGLERPDSERSRTFGQLVRLRIACLPVCTEEEAEETMRASIKRPMLGHVAWAARLPAAMASRFLTILGHRFPGSCGCAVVCCHCGGPEALRSESGDRSQNPDEMDEEDMDDYSQTDCEEGHDEALDPSDLGCYASTITWLLELAVPPLPIDPYALAGVLLRMTVDLAESSNPSKSGSAVRESIGSKDGGYVKESSVGSGREGSIIGAATHRPSISSNGSSFSYGSPFSGASHELQRLVLRMIEAVSKHPELATRLKLAGLRDVVDLILEHYCSYFSDPVLVPAALKTLEAIFTDFSFEAEDYERFHDIVSQLASMFKSHGQSVGPALAALLAANLELATILVQGPDASGQLRASVYRAFCATISADKQRTDRLTSASSTALDGNLAATESGATPTGSIGTHLATFLMYHPQILEVLCEVCPCTEGEKLCNAVLGTISDVKLAKTMAKLEISSVTSGADLFRQNSNSMRVLMAWLRQRSDWISHVVARFVHDLSEGKVKSPLPRSESSLNSEELGTFAECSSSSSSTAPLSSCSTAAVCTNSQVGAESALCLMRRLTASADLVPSDVRQLLIFIRDEVSQRFKGHEMSALTTVAVIRLIGPILVSPQGAVDVPDGMVPLLRNVAVHLQRDAHELGMFLNRLLSDSDSDDLDQTIGGVSPPPSPTRTVSVSSLASETDTSDQSGGEDGQSTGYVAPAESCSSKQDCQVVAAAALHTLLYRHGPEIKHVLLRAHQRDLSVSFARLLRSLGRPVLRLQPPVFTTMSDGALASLTDWHGQPCVLAITRKVAELDPDVGAFVYWFHRVLRQGLELLSDENSKIVALYDQTGGSVSLNKWQSMMECTTVLPHDVAERFGGAYFLNVPYIMADSSTLPSRGSATYITGHDITIGDISGKGWSELTRTSVTDLPSAMKFSNVEVQVMGHRVDYFDVFVGRHTVQFVNRHQISQIVSNDVFTAYEINADDCTQLVSSRCAFEYTFTLVRPPKMLRWRLRTLRSRTLSLPRSPAVATVTADASSGMSGDIRGNIALILLLCLADLRAPQAELRDSAHQLFALLPERFNLRLGLPPLRLEPVHISSLSRRAAVDCPDLVPFVCMAFLGLPQSRMVEVATVAAPWFAHLESHTPLSKEIITRLVAVDDPIAWQAIVDHVWPHVSGCDELVVEAVHAAAVSAELQKQCLDRFQAIIGSRDFRAELILLDRLERLLGSDAMWTTTCWSHHPNWAEVEVIVVLLVALPLGHAMHIPPQSHMIQLHAQLSWLVLVFAGVGSFRFRASVHQIVANCVALHVDNNSTPSSVAQRLRALWSSIESPRGLVTFGVQPEAREWVYDASAEVGPETAEHLAKIVAELCMAVCGNELSVYRSIRGVTAELLLKYSEITFPALQRRCVLALHGILRFQMPDSVPLRLMTGLRRVIMECPDSAVVELHAAAVLRSLSDLVDSLHDNSNVPSQLAWLALGMLSTATVPLLAPASRLLVHTLRSLHYRGGFSIENLLSEMPSDWNEKYAGTDVAVALPASRENFTPALAELLIPGLQRTHAQATTLDVCECLVQLLPSRGHTSDVFPFALFMYMATAELAKLHAVADALNVGPAEGPGKAELMHVLKQRLADELPNSDTNLIALVQGSRISGFANSMCFMSWGPRLLELACAVHDRDTVLSISPLLRPTLSRLLELEDTDLSHRIMSWSMKLFTRNPSEREKLTEACERVANVERSYGLPVAVAPDFALLPNLSRESLQPEVRTAIAELLLELDTTAKLNGTEAEAVVN